MGPWVEGEADSLGGADHPELGAAEEGRHRGVALLLHLHQRDPSTVSEG